eukprot:sb/3464707/
MYCFHDLIYCIISVNCLISRRMGLYIPKNCCGEDVLHYLRVLGRSSLHCCDWIKRRISTLIQNSRLVYCELFSKYIIVTLLVVLFIIAYACSVYINSRGGSNHHDENLLHWTWFESLYYALISLTTIGFGDYFMPSASDKHEFYNCMQGLLIVIVIIFGFGLFTYAFSEYTEASKRQMKVLRERYEELATKNAILAFTQHIYNPILLRGGYTSATAPLAKTDNSFQLYTNSESFMEKSQQAMKSGSQNIRKISSAIEEVKDCPQPVAVVHDYDSDPSSSDIPLMVRQRFQNNFIPEQHDQDSLHRPNIRLKTFSSESDSSYKSLTTKSPPVTSTRRKPVWPLLNIEYTEASKRQMKVLRERYEELATKNAILAFTQFKSKSSIRSMSRAASDVMLINKLSKRAQKHKKRPRYSTKNDEKNHVSMNRPNQEILVADWLITSHVI